MGYHSSANALPAEAHFVGDRDFVFDDAGVCQWNEEKEKLDHASILRSNTHLGQETKGNE